VAAAAPGVRRTSDGPTIVQARAPPGIRGPLTRRPQRSDCSAGGNQSRIERSPRRIDGYAPIRDYAAIGDGHTVALVALDGAVDWLCLPHHDSPPLFAALLDAERGGSFELRPDVPFGAARRYVPDTNVLETTFTTAGGSVRVTDALTLLNGVALPWRELVRRVDGLAGAVPMVWRVRASNHGGSRTWKPLAWEAGAEGKQSGRFELRAGETAHLALVDPGPGPCPRPARDEIDERLDGTAEAWRRWIGAHTYEHEWKDSVVRSLLALELLVCRPTGAIVAAPTTSLPERLGGRKNWDYRYAWTRDSCWTIQTLIGLGFRSQAHESFGWLLGAIRGTHPNVDPIYELDGSVLRHCEELDWPGYRGSPPVVVGNRAGDQLQLGGYGDLLDTAWGYVEEGNELDPETARLLAGVADRVCEIWGKEDSGIWELPEPRHFTQSKVACWTALRRAIDLAENGWLPRGESQRWRESVAEIERFVEERCWADGRRSYLQYPGSDALDASDLLCARRGYGDIDRRRFEATVDAVRRELGRGALLYRYTGAEHEEGTFVACSFWLVEALARIGRVDEAARLMDETLVFANDVGLFSEQIDPESGAFLGNFPQGLSHLSLIRAALSLTEARAGTD
jgi:GH15 family glucan-1,4-alpha-glucosidase